MIRIRNPQDFAAGIFFIVIGVGALYFLHHIRAGSATNMGPAYIPNVVAGGMAVVGLMLVAGALIVSGPALERLSIVPLLVICGAALVFGLLITKAGLVLASFALVVLASFGMRGVKWLQILAFAVILSLGAALLFKGLIGLPMHLWPWR